MLHGYHRNDEQESSPLSPISRSEELTAESGFPKAGHMREKVAGSETPVVRVGGFTKRYKKHVAVNGVDLMINKGEIYGLIGPDGAGKSSLMKAIAGVLSYDGGAVEVFGTLVDSERAAEQVKQRQIS